MMIGAGMTMGESDGSTVGAPRDEDVGATDGTVVRVDGGVGADVIMGARLTVSGSDGGGVGSAETVVLPNSSNHFLV